MEMSSDSKTKMNMVADMGYPTNGLGPPHLCSGGLQQGLQEEGGQE